MAAFPKFGKSYTGSHMVPKRHFDRIVATCENPPPAPDALRELIARGSALLKRG
jgi:hypothetical protein